MKPPLGLLLAAFGCIYLLWGATFLAIRFAIETIPPFLMAGVRFLSAGAILYGWCRGAGVPCPERRHWKDAALLGALLFLGGNGGISWSEQYVPSGLAALIIATIPIWMAVLGWLWRIGPPPGAGTWAGLALGFAGIALLVGPSGTSGGEAVSLPGAAVLILASALWAGGSLISRTARLPSHPLMATSMQLLCGGAFLVALGLGAGEGRLLDPTSVSLRSWLALAFLVLFGSVVTFSAYIWLLRVSTPARVSTYAYVNPVVALYLGWGWAGEPVTARTLLATLVILAGVAVITTRGPGADRAVDLPGGAAPRDAVIPREER